MMADGGRASADPAHDLVAEVLADLEDGKSVRRDLPGGGRVHVDRPLPLLCVHEGAGNDASAAREVATANAAYLLSPDLATLVPLVNALARAMRRRHGAFLVVDVGELKHDRLLGEDSPYLPPFETIVTHEDRPAARAAFGAFAQAMANTEVRYRSPRVEGRLWRGENAGWTGGLDADIARLRIRFAPIYRQPESGKTYPDLRERVIANVFDAVLQAIAAFLAAAQGTKLATHRALGRRVFVDTVKRLDARIDRVARSFDFLLATTPINAAAAWHEFRAGRFAKEARFLYRPLTVQTDVEKRRLFSIRFDNLEDPLLHDLYREKQQELDLQLTLLALRDTPRFREASRLLYGAVASDQLAAAAAILAQTGRSDRPEAEDGQVASGELARDARRMLRAYRAAAPGFPTRIQVRDDLPPGMMVTGDRLLIARSTRMARGRVEAMLSHEIGVHLFTYFAGDAQGLRVFRSGLAGYEGVQEGLAVFAEYLVGGMTPARLRLIAARTVGCAAMLAGADFVETFGMLTREHGFADAVAFNIALRLYRSGGLAKDAIYLRGLLAVLDHLKRGGSLDPFWMGKIAPGHFPAMQELAARGLLRAPSIRPAFLTHPQAGPRLAAAGAGLSPIDLLAS